jgi:hypothetical protein
VSNRNDIKITISGDAEGLARELAKAKANIGKFSSEGEKALVSLRAAWGTLAAAVAGFASGKIVATIAEFERLNASLKTITGSSENAKAAMGFLREFAATTTYQLQEVVTAFTKLSAMGLDPSREALESYGNTASAMGKNLNQMVEAVADAATGEFERLKEFGIKAKSEGDKVSFTFQGTTTTVAKNAAEIEKYLISIGKVQFAGAMAEQMNTLGGKISNLKDAWDALIAQFGESGGSAAGQGVVDGLIWSVEKLKVAMDALPKVFVSLFAGIEKGWEHVAYAFAVVGTQIKYTFLEVVAELRKVYGKFLETVADGLDYVPGAGKAAAHLHNKSAGLIGGVDANLKAWEGSLAKLRKDHEQRLATIDDAAMASFLDIDKANTSGGKYTPKGRKGGAAGGVDDKAAKEAEKERLAEIKHHLDAQVDANEQLLAVTEELETAQLSKDDKAIRAIQKEHELLLNKSHLLTLMGQQTVEEGARIKEVLGTRMQEQLDDLKDKGKDTAKELKDAFSGWASNMGRDLNEVLWGADLTFGKIGESFGRMITQMAIQKKVVEPIVSGFDSFNWSSVASFLSSFANGGIMTSAGPLPLRKYSTGGVAYTPQVAIFGEGRTPEAFVPLPDGRRIPVTMSGGGANVQVVINNNASGTQATARESRDGSGNRIVEVMIDQVKGAIARDISNGDGVVPTAMSRAYGLNRVAGAY